MLNKNELKELSKYKYIYEAYFDRNGIINIEQFPIVYANKNIIYYKKGASSYLDYVKVGSQIFTDDHELFCNLLVNSYHHNYLLTKCKHTKEDLYKYVNPNFVTTEKYVKKRRQEIDDRKQEINIKKSYLQQLIDECNQYTKETEEMEKELEELIKK